MTFLPERDGFLLAAALDARNTQAPHASRVGCPPSFEVMAMTDVKEKTPESIVDEVLSEPSALLTKRPMPTKKHTLTTSDGSKVTVLLQGLTFMEKSEVDALAKQERDEDATQDTSRPNLWGPRLFARACRTATGKRAYPQMHEWLGFAVAFAEQCSDGEVNRAVNAVLELSGYGAGAVEKAVKP